jgi:hypothetical protein
MFWRDSIPMGDQSYALHAAKLHFVGFLLTLLGSFMTIGIQTKGIG